MVTDKPVYRDYSQSELDAQYDQLTMVGDRAPYVRIWQDKSAEARAKHPHLTDIAYGAGTLEKVDIYPAQKGPAPVVLFVHGGAWLREMRAHAHYPALGLKQADICYIAAGFSAVPNTDLRGMVAHVRRCLAWVWRHAADYGGDPGWIFLAGHSSGAHLSAMAAAAGWQATEGLPEQTVKGVCLVSGLYDLEPVQLSARNEYLHLTLAEVPEMSPARHMPVRPTPHIIAWGDRDLDEFQRQSQDYAAGLEAAGHPVETIAMTGTNHFEMANLYANPASQLVRSLLAMVAA